MIRTRFAPTLLAVTGLVLAAGLVAPSPARADRDWNEHGGRWHGYYEGPRSYYPSPPVYYFPPPAYYAPPPVYYAPPPAYYAPPAAGVSIVVPGLALGLTVPLH